MAIRIIIADDDSLIRESLKIILGMDDEIEVVKCVEDGLKAVEACVAHHVDVALLDVRMPVMNGVEAARKITSETNAKTLILTTFDEDDYIMEAIKNGARGYILKNNTPDKIIAAIKTVASGSAVMQDVVMEKVKENLAMDKKMDDSLFSQREMDVIKEIAKGLSNKEIAAKLYISEGTVKNYITSILSKTGLEHRTQIAIFYLKGGKMS